MKTLTCLTGLLLACYLAPAQINYDLIKRQARDAGAAAGNASQGIAPTAPSGISPGAAVSPATRQNLASLADDITNLGKATADNLDPALKLSLLNDLAAAAQGTKPATDALKKFAGNFCTTLVGHKFPAAQATRLAQVLHSLMNSSQLSDLERQALPKVLQNILAHAGIADADASSLVDSLKAVMVQTQ